ncbi:aldo/keto reductase [Streptomyces sp. JV176]|uniref:aldo/keto reductase n=1 Tax=Streptomyces sp. JV176 TaxID=858630 RepID=UPI002E7A8A68|nr:aldo/keto reductase [Streptomyces sp. JV176]MEE1800747.1 aldo/keto reductase [Streptomyces sp. JV176]
MKYTRLGTSGLSISRIALGTMGFGDGSREKWALGYEAAAPFFQQALDLGITFWDTANIYSFGASEETVGRAVEQFARRDDIVLATKDHHLPAAAAALDITLTDDEVTALEEHYVLREPTYF